VDFRRQRSAPRACRGFNASAGASQGAPRTVWPIRSRCTRSSSKWKKHGGRNDQVPDSNSARVARRDGGGGARHASPPIDAAKPSFNSVDAVVRLLTPENRQLLAIMRDSRGLQWIISHCACVWSPWAARVRIPASAPCRYFNTADSASAPSATVTTPTIRRRPFSGRRRTVRVATGTESKAPPTSGMARPQLI